MKYNLSVLLVFAFLSVLAIPMASAQTFLPGIASMPDLQQPDALRSVACAELAQLLCSGLGRQYLEVLRCLRRYQHRSVDRLGAVAQPTVRVGNQLVDFHYSGPGNGSTRSAGLHEHERHCDPPGMGWYSYT
jgi:hypothetical protein